MSLDSNLNLLGALFDGLCVSRYHICAFHEAAQWPSPVAFRSIMARTRARAANSTAQPSTAARTTSAKRTRLDRRTKPRNLYESDPDSENDSPDDSDASLESFHDSDDDVATGADRALLDIVIDAPRATPNRRGRPSKQQSASRLTPQRAVKKRRKAHRALGAPRKKPKRSNEAPASSAPVGRIPNWLDPKIPYSAWVDIFLYAARAGGTLDNSWLVHAATTCRAFMQPALTGLYKCPTPSTSLRARKLMTILEKTEAETLIRYKPIIEAMYIDIDLFPVGSLPPVLASLQRLKELIVFTKLDQPPYRALDKSLRWQYPEQLFESLELGQYNPRDESETSPIVLKSWEWSSRMLGGTVPDIAAISRIHKLSSFSHLTKVSFINFQTPSLHKPVAKTPDEALEIELADEAVVDEIAAAIACLGSLRHLVFEASTTMNDRMLTKLPAGLAHLELINCWEVRSEDLDSFLQSHGSSLRYLTLSHNQSLSLEFVTNLAVNCPNLAELRMNLSYYRHHETIDDSDAMYDQALLPGQVPLWPSSLQLIEIEHVREWTVEAAETFLQSLVDSAPNLPRLRHLAIKTVLNIPWQRRAELRQGWTDRMDHVFLRPFVPPSHNVTLRQEENVAAPHVEEAPPKPRKRAKRGSPSRRSGRIAAHSASDTDRHSSRPRNRPQYREPDTDEDEQEEEESADGHSSGTESERGGQNEPQAEKLPVQGMCDTVLIVIDNQKTRELQYSMEDFQDEANESSGEEWNEDNEVEDDDYAW